MSFLFCLSSSYSLRRETFYWLCESPEITIWVVLFIKFKAFPADAGLLRQARRAFCFFKEGRKPHNFY
jgi:hypothetical protein